MEERLQKYLAQAGIASRRSAEKMIAEGRVKVNGKVVREQGVKVDGTKDIIEVDNKPVRVDEEYVYLLINKPPGCVTTVKDPGKRPTVMDVVSDIPKRVYPVGRLDFDTTGLLLMTNDGEFAYRMTHPKFAISKVYEAYVLGQVSEEKLDKLRNGIMLEDGMTKPAKVKVLRKENRKTLIEITISEGRKRQVRRMFQAINNPVIDLKRVKVENLTLGKVKEGEYRYLTFEELRPLMNKVQLGAQLEKMMQKE